ncbi:MAG: HTTM domain-containing protein [Acidobacteriaceae bacterium]
MKASDSTKLTAFLFPAVSDWWLTLLRRGMALQVALTCLTLRSDWQYLFSSKNGGMVNRHLGEAILDLRSTAIPRLGWLVRAGHQLGLREETVLFLAWLCLLVAALFLLLGLFCRTSAIAAWFLYLCAVKSGNLFSYGVDNFVLIGLFYLMIAPLPDRSALDASLFSAAPPNPQRLGFHLRVLQLHLSLIYFFGGITKATGQGWWNGTSIWRALSSPPFDYVPLSTLISLRPLLILGGICVCLLEAAYPIFIWPRRTRLLWLAGVIGMHVGIALTMGLYLFSLVMIVLNLAGFGSQLHLKPPRFFRLTAGHVRL